MVYRNWEIQRKALICELKKKKKNPHPYELQACYGIATLKCSSGN